MSWIAGWEAHWVEKEFGSGERCVDDADADAAWQAGVECIGVSVVGGYQKDHCI